MKVKDIVEYGMIDEPAPGQSRAAIRKTISTANNQNRRGLNRQKDANDNANISAQQAARAERRARKSPTGIPARLMQPESKQ